MNKPKKVAKQFAREDSTGIHKAGVRLQAGSKNGINKKSNSSFASFFRKIARGERA